MLIRHTHSLQLQGELQRKQEAPRLYKGVTHGMGVIVKNEGVKGLLRGLNCAVSLSLSYTTRTCNHTSWTD